MDRDTIELTWTVEVDDTPEPPEPPAPPDDPEDPVLLFTQADCRQGTWLAGVAPALNKVEALFNWGDSEPPHDAVFSLNGHERVLLNVGDAVQTTYDMGLDLVPGDNVLEVFGVSSDGGVSNWDTLHWSSVGVTPWAGPESAWGANGYRCYPYSRATLPFVVDTSSAHVDIDLPVIGGPLGIVGSTLKFPELIADPQGTATTGELVGSLIFGAADRAWPVEIGGTERCTLSPSGLTLQGNATVGRNVGPFTKSVGVLDVIPPAVAWCNSGGSITGVVCDALNSAANMQATISGRVSLTGDYASTATDIDWTGGSAAVEARGTLTLNLSLPYLERWVAVGGGGGVGACADLRVAPELGLTEWGAYVQAFATATWAGDQYEVGRYEWPVAGSGCGRSAARSASREAAMAAGPLSDTLGWASQPTAASIGDAVVVAWSAPGPGGDGLDVRVPRLDGDVDTWTTELTSDPNVDQRPSIAVDDAGRVLVAWEHSFADAAPTEPAGLDAWALTFEIAYAVLDATTGEVLQRGTLTNDAAFDIGPTLQRGRDGSVLLAWQSCAGPELFGTPADPVTVRVAWWNGNRWSRPEVGLPGTAGVFGWRAACGGANRALVACALDHDGDLATGGDREMHVVEYDGSWSPPRRLTDDDVMDSGPLVAFSPSGVPVLGWMHGDAVVGLVGDLSADPQEWLPAGAEAVPSFSYGSLLARENDVLVALPSGAGAVVHDYVPADGPVAEAPTAVGARDVTSDPTLLEGTSGRVMLAALHRDLLEDLTGSTDEGTLQVDVVPRRLPCLAGDIHPDDVGDGALSLADYVLGRRKSLATEPPSPRDVTCGDIAPGILACARASGPGAWCPLGNGRLQADDADAIRRLLLGTWELSCVTCAPESQAVSRRMPGDVAPRGAPDGRVTVADVVLLLRAAVRLEAISADNAPFADIAPLGRDAQGTVAGGDGVVDVADVVLALRIAVGIEAPSWPEREIVLATDADAPGVALLAVITDWPDWALVASEGAATCGGSAEARLDVAVDRLALTCVSDPQPLGGAGELATIRYRAPVAVEPVALTLRTELVDAQLDATAASVSLATRP